MSRSVIAAVFVVCISVAAQAAVTTSFTSSPTVDLAGYTTYIVTLTSDTGDLTGFEVSFDGPMNQMNLFDLSTIFIPDIQTTQFAPHPIFDWDSHFLFYESDLIVVPGASESPTHLAAIFAFTGASALIYTGPSVEIAQIIIADGNTVEMTGEVSVGVTIVAFADFTIPEPATISLLAIGGIAMLRRKR